MDWFLVDGSRKETSWRIQGEGPAYVFSIRASRVSTSEGVVGSIQTCKLYGFNVMLRQIPANNPLAAVDNDLQLYRYSLTGPDDVLLVYYVGHGDLRGTTSSNCLHTQGKPSFNSKLGYVC